nr:immunoglobulin light chain junction region [Macaca mulatta]
CLQYNDLLRTF